jgi:transcriptional regulator with XRE-family HTH domain
MKQSKFGERLRELREEKKYSIKKLATTLGVNYTYVSKIENNRSIPSSEVIEKLATVFNVDISELKLQAGKIPDDVMDILKNNPKEVIEYLRREFGDSQGLKQG